MQVCILRQLNRHFKCNILIKDLNNKSIRLEHQKSSSRQEARGPRSSPKKHFLAINKQGQMLLLRKQVG